MSVQLPNEWVDDNPYYLLIVTDDGAVVTIDLGARGWMKTYADHLRKPGRWHLVRKLGHAVVGIVVVLEGEQPYYVARHVGTVSGDGQNRSETIAYGIGKKRLDGHTDRLWFLANGSVTVGDDLEGLAILLLRQGNL